MPDMIFEVLDYLVIVLLCCGPRQPLQLDMPETLAQRSKTVSFAYGPDVIKNERQERKTNL